MQKTHVEIGSVNAPLVMLFLHFYKSFNDLGQIGLWWFGFRLKSIFTTVSATLRNNTRFKSGQNRLKNHHLGP